MNKRRLFPTYFQKTFSTEYIFRHLSYIYIDKPTWRIYIGCSYTYSNILTHVINFKAYADCASFPQLYKYIKQEKHMTAIKMRIIAAREICLPHAHKHCGSEIGRASYKMTCISQGKGPPLVRRPLWKSELAACCEYTRIHYFSSRNAQPPCKLQLICQQCIIWYYWVCLKFGGDSEIFNSLRWEWKR